MARRVLVLHGPTLTLEAALGQKLSDLDDELVRRGRELDLDVEAVQANGEAALVDALLARREGLHGVIVNPASLAPIAFALADTLEVLGVRCIEVQLHHESKARGRSALRRIVDRQLHGQGVEGYFKALTALAKDAVHPSDARERATAGSSTAGGGSEAGPRGTSSTGKTGATDAAARTSTARDAGTTSGEPKRAADGASTGNTSAARASTDGDERDDSAGASTGNDARDDGDAFADNARASTGNDDADEPRASTDDDTPDEQDETGADRKDTGGPATRGKTIGRKKPQSATASASPNGKTIGRKPPGASPSSPRAPVSAPSAAITRALVREQITARLGKKLPPEELARWARTQWLAVQHGASTEPGQHELLETVLLMLSTSAKASDHVILSYAAKLGA